MSSPGFLALRLSRAAGHDRLVGAPESCCVLVGVALIEPMASGGQQDIGGLVEP